MSPTGVSVAPLTPASAPEWDAFVAAHPDGTAAHLSTWGPLIRGLFGHPGHYLQAHADDGSLRGILPLIQLKSVLFGNFLVSMPYLNNGGVLALDEAAREALMTQAERLGTRLNCSHVEYRNDSELSPALAQARPVRTDKVAMELLLPSEEAILSKALGSKLRSQIRRPGKSGAVAVRGGIELLDEFYVVFARNMRDLGTPVYSRRFFAAIMETFVGQTELVLVRVDGTPAAAGFLLGYKDRLEIPWASTDRRFNRISVNMLLYWEVLRGAIEQGYRRFDFGRSTKNAGTYRFKAQWGAEPRQLWWYYWLAPGKALPALTPTSGKFKLAVQAWQKLPLPLANLMGPHLVKNLP